MKQEDAIRIAEECLPSLLRGEDNDSCIDSNSSNKKASQKKSAADGDAAGVVQSVRTRRVCGLWGGMGSIYRLDISVRLVGPPPPPTSDSCIRRFQVAVKHIPSPLGEPDPASMSFGDCRKSRAYQVEANFYETARDALLRRQRCLSSASELRIPRLYHLDRGDRSITMCIEWIDGRTLGEDPGPAAANVRMTLRWLARFHAATWIGGSSSPSSAPDVDDLVERCGLHGLGSYWHLETRPDEHEDMPRRGWEGRLRTAARAIHECLKRDPMQCLIHGDVKAENVLLPSVGGSEAVTMCDYQYCGKGPPTKDLAYYFCSSVDLSSPAEGEELLKWYYRDCLLPALSSSRSEGNAGSAPQTLPSFEHLKDSLEIAYADFCRFMSGWGYWGDVPMLKKRVQAFLAKLDKGKDLGSEQAYDEAIRNLYW